MMANLSNRVWIRRLADHAIENGFGVLSFPLNPPTILCVKSFVGSLISNGNLIIRHVEACFGALQVYFRVNGRSLPRRIQNFFRSCLIYMTRDTSSRRYIVETYVSS